MAQTRSNKNKKVASHRGSKQSPGVKAKMAMMWHQQGLSKREIARKLGKGWYTVNRALSEIEFADEKEFLRKSREEFRRLFPKAADSYAFALDNEEDGRIASKYMDQAKVAAPQVIKEVVSDAVDRTDPAYKEKLKENIAIKMYDVIKERAKIFKQGDLIEEMEALLEEKKKVD